MFEVILGALLGTCASLLIAHFYYRRSTRDLDVQVERLAVMNRELQEATEIIREDIGVTKRQVVAGTPADPAYPYK